MTSMAIIRKISNDELRGRLPCLSVCLSVCLSIGFRCHSVNAPIINIFILFVVEGEIIKDS